MTKFIKYVVESGMLTLTFLLDDGQEIVLSIHSNMILDRMALDLLNMSYDDVYIRKITPTGEHIVLPTRSDTVLDQTLLDMLDITSNNAYIRKVTRTIDPDGAILYTDDDVEYQEGHGKQAASHTSFLDDYTF